MSKSPNKTGGPVVKSGPTKGKNRSRNDDGRWRKKRADTGKSRGSKSGSGKSEKSGCFLTTAACQYKGLPDDCDVLTTMRSFRDNVLMRTEEGSNLVAQYYERAPNLVPLFEDPRIADLAWHQICKISDLIKAERNAEAVAVYHEMVVSLERENAPLK